VSFDDRLRQTFVIRRMAASTGSAAETAGGADTTLTADTTAGATTLPVASAVGIADGNWLRVGDTGEAEIRQVAVGGVTGLTVTLSAPLSLSHDAGDQVREVDDAGTYSVDEYGQPVMTPVTVATVPGLMQPRSAREAAAANQAGVAVGDHVGYLRPVDGLATDCWVEVGGFRYDVVTIADAAGLGHHLELGTRRVD
jgi:hypothetical protein